jgi:NTE family protein
MCRRLGFALILFLLPGFAASQTVESPRQLPQLNPLQAKAEPAQPGKRLKIGVALEGGGALGLAHIGVLQWFEDHHIPIDYIAGTSMGGLVGGLYAIGKSPAQLKALVAAQDWDTIIGGEVPYEDLSFRRKEDRAAYPNSLKLGIKHGLAPPEGLNTGHKIGLLIDRETLPYSNVASFDDLPIPFRCVATDLVSGEEVVFKQGELSQAMRATMSLPGIFAPVHDGEKVYVDGGLVGNLPTDVVRLMGADIVIAVHLESAPVNADGIRSLFQVLGRSIDVVIRDNEIRGLAGADLIVKVELQDFNSMQYERSAAIIEKGMQAAEQKAQVLAPHSLDDSAWQDYLHQRDTRKSSVVVVPQFVKVEGASPQSERSIERLLQPLVRRPVDPEMMDRLLTRLTGNGRFSSASYRMGRDNGRSGLIITVAEHSYAPPTLQLGFEVDGSEPIDVTFTQAARLNFMDIAGYRSEWRTDLLFGNTYGVASDFYKPFSILSRWFLGPYASATDTSFRIYNKSNPVGEYRLGRAEIGADLGFNFSRFAELRFGYEVGYFNAKLRLGTPEFSSVGGRTGNGRLRFLMDHTDDAVIPRQGYRIETNARMFDTYPSVAQALPALDTQIGYFQPITEPASLFVTADGGSAFGRNQSGVPLYFLGGPSRLAAYGTNELFGNQYYLFRMGYLHDLLTLPPFVGKKAYAIGTYEFAKMYGFRNESGFPNDVSVGVLAETAVGPFFIGGSVGDSGHRKWFFQLGRVF